MLFRKCCNICLCVVFLFGILSVSKAQGAGKGPFKVLYLMSYHMPWEWTEDQLKGFKDRLKGLDVHYKTFAMDTKRKSSPDWIEKVSRQALERIAEWQPNLIYATDDNAQKYVISRLVGTDVPVVFSGVNGDPEDYGFVGAENITGVLERAHIVQTVKLLQKIVPGVSRLAVIVDSDPTWNGVLERMKQKLARECPEIEVSYWDVLQTYAQYQDKILAYQDEVDGIGLLGIHAFTDNNGENVPWREVLQWTAKHSSLPDFSFWKDRVGYGTLAVVYVSGYEQGLAAGRMARGILAEGRSPSSYPIRPTVKGQPVISLARAWDLGIKIESTLLLTSKLVTEYAWEN
ncbi:MAG: hypothetical protein K9J81_07665 [Desulfohalobiaceae bacterium]|nr:hypothetical protein [Desulfohalobiaceae bacterium]